MPKVYLFSTFSKRPNSTRRPALTSGAEMDCTFREGYDILAPQILLDLRQGDGYGNPVGYTYAYVEDLRRYYYVVDWTFAGGMWTCYLTVDALASHKEAIGQTYIFAQRLADRLRNGTTYDGGITDTMLPTLAEPAHAYTRATNSIFKSSLDQGSYIIGVINSDNTTAGATAYYILTPAQFRVFRAALMANGGQWMQSTSELSTDTIKTILNPIQYVSSCMWYPFAPDYMADDSTLYVGMPLGWWPLQTDGTDAVTYRRIKPGGVVRWAESVEIPIHPQYATTRMKMLKMEPYSAYMLNVPYFGGIPIKYEDFPGGVIGIVYAVDLISGRGTIQLYDGRVTETSGFPAARLVTQAVAQVATPIQLAQLTTDSEAANVQALNTAASVKSQYSMSARKWASTAAAIVGGIVGTITAPGVGTAAGAAAGAAIVAGVGKLADAALSQPASNANVDAANAAGLYNEYSAGALRMSSQGANGSILGPWVPTELSATYLLLSTTAPEIYERCGYAAGWPTIIGQHTGYVQGLLADFHAGGVLPAERTIIQTAIEGGLYYE